MPLQNQTLNSEIQEVMGKPPSWLTSAGSGIVLLIILSVVLILSFIKIPQSINGVFTVKRQISMKQGFAFVLQFPEESLSALKPNSEVQLYFNAYPSESNGYVVASIDSLSPQIMDGKKLDIRITVADTVVSSIGKKIVLLEGMTGSTKVIVGHTTLLYNLF